MKKYQKIINVLILFKSVIKHDCFIGKTINMQFYNQNYYVCKINDIIDAFINKNKDAIKTSLLILKTYDYLLNKKNKKSIEYLNNLNEVLKDYEKRY